MPNEEGKAEAENLDLLYLGCGWVQAYARILYQVQKMPEFARYKTQLANSWAAYRQSYPLDRFKGVARRARNPR